MKYVDCYKDRHGKMRYYYRRGGKRVALPGDPNSSDWINAYAAVHATFEAGGNPGSKPGTFEAVMHSYLAGARYRSLKPKTQYAYKLRLREVAEKIGHLPVASITRGAVIRIRDRVAENRSPRIAIEIIKVISQVMGHATDCDLIPSNPALRIPSPHGYKAKPHRPWTADEIKIFLAGAKPLWRRAVTVLLYTGLRRDDVINLERRHIIGNQIRLTLDDTGDTTGKTGAEVVIPMHPNLVQELETPLPVENMTLIVPSTRGRKIRGDVLTESIQKQARKLGIENPPPVHGLRKNAVMFLLEIGVKYEDINSFTGQSMQMIKHYGKSYDRNKAASRVEQKIMQSLS